MGLLVINSSTDRRRASLLLAPKLPIHTFHAAISRAKFSVGRYNCEVGQEGQPISQNKWYQPFQGEPISQKGAG